MPLVYIDSRSYGDITATYPLAPNDITGAAKPYLSDRVKQNSPFGYEWANETTFQIISAGRDNHYGSYVFRQVVTPPQLPLFPRFPSGVNYDPPLPITPAVSGFPGVGGDEDNITNFSNGGTLGSAKP